jgi:hypothetical protein
VNRRKDLGKQELTLQLFAVGIQGDRFYLFAEFPQVFRMDLFAVRFHERQERYLMPFGQTLNQVDKDPRAVETQFG